MLRTRCRPGPRPSIVPECWFVAEEAALADKESLPSMNAEKRQSRVLIAAAFAVCLVGAWVSGDLVRQHADIWGKAGKRQGLFARICQSSEQIGFNCTDSLKSPWSQITIPVPMLLSDTSVSVKRTKIPVAFLGLSYFVFMAVWFAMIGRPRPPSPRLHRLPLYVARGGGLFSLFYLGIMATGHASWCLSCCVVHALTFAMLFLVSRMFRIPGVCARTPIFDETSTGFASLPRATTGEAVRAIGVSLCIIAGLFIHRRAHLVFEDTIDSLRPYRQLVDSLRTDPEFLMREYQAQPVYGIPPRPTEAGGSDRPQLAVFTDFECPACYCNALRVRKTIVAAFNGRLQVMVRHYPLCRSCNPDAHGDSHAHSCEAARAAEAARHLGGEAVFAKMHESLFANRKRLGRPLYRELAETLGLPPDRLLKEMDSEDVKAIVAADVALARQLGVNGTPAMFLNGRRITELCEGPLFWKLAANRLTASPESDAVPVPDAIARHVAESLE